MPVTLTNHHRVVSLALTFVALVSACGAADSDAGYETADRIMARAGVESDAGAATPTTEPCEVEQRQDEYGLTFDVCVQADGSLAAPSTEDGSTEDGSTEEVLDETLREPRDLLPLGRYRELVDQMPDGSARSALVELGVALDQMDRSCGATPTAWRQAAVAVSDRARATVAVLSTGPDEDLAAFRQSGSARELERVLVERAVLQSGCVAPASGSMTRTELLPVTAGLAASTEALTQEVVGTTTSAFFYHPDELAHWQWMRTEGSVDIVVAGTSQTLLGVEPDLLEISSGRSVGNVAIPGAVAEVQEYWLPQVLTAVGPDIVVWGIGPLDLVSVCPLDGRDEEFRRLELVKQEAFGMLPWARSTAGVDLIMGRPGAGDYTDTATVAEVDARFRGVRGDAFEFANPDPVELVASVDRFRAPFDASSVCVERLPFIRRVLSELEAAGVRVIIFGMPIAPSLSGLYQGGDEALDRLVDQTAAQVFVPGGAEYVGMMQSIDDDGLWYDVVHPTRAGGELMTAELAEALRAVGL